MSFFTDDDRKARAKAVTEKDQALRAAQAEYERKKEEFLRHAPIEMMEDLKNKVRNMFRNGEEVRYVNIRDNSPENEDQPGIDLEELKKILEREIVRQLNVSGEGFEVEISHRNGSSRDYDEWYQLVVATISFNPPLA